MPLALAILAALILLFLYAWFLEPARLEIRRELIDVAPSLLSKPVRLLFLSDLHASSLVSPWVWRMNLAALERHRSRHPFDAVLLGGDYVDRDPRCLSQAKDLIRQLVSWGVPVYAVLGNHDYKSYKGEIRPLRRQLADLGVTVLVNEATVLAAQGQKVEIVGLDDLQHTPEYWRRGQRVTPQQYVERARRLGWYQDFDGRPETVRVLLSHNPDAAYLPGRRPDLIVAGHTHGGQYLFMGWVPAWVTNRFLFPKGSFMRWAGRRLVEGRNLVVSRGFGGSWLPARFLRRPDVLDITLQPADYPKVVIGVSGKPRSGKDTVTAMIEAILPGIARSDFSRIMRTEFDQEHGTAILHDDHEKERLRQELTDFVNAKRKIDPDYWVKKAFAAKPPVVVPSIRFENEIREAKRVGGYVIRVVADPSRLRKRIRQDFDAQYKMQNEVQLDHFHDFDYVIRNDGTLLELEAKVRSVVAEILEKTKQQP